MSKESTSAREDLERRVRGLLAQSPSKGASNDGTLDKSFAVGAIVALSAYALGRFRRRRSR